MEAGLPRKLAVILHADVVGSTTLVQQDESIAHTRIRDAYRRFSKLISRYGGTAHEVRGDALVAEFARASDAITAALAFQTENELHNQTLDGDVRPAIRIGISMGEVVVADGTLTGAGVVIAQRLEQLAVAGGVVVQGSVAETVPTRLPFEFESLGEQALKGFDRLVRAFVGRLKVGFDVPAPDATTPDSEVMSMAGKGGERRLPQELPDKPSIAVLPFVNMTGDPGQEYFSDGITEDVITSLSRFRDLFVIARNSSFAYKGRSVNIQTISQELGVRYVLEGSVQRSKDRVRVTAQLIDGDSGRHLWAERYDRQIEDIFALQDEVTELIVGTLATGYGGRLRKAWQRRGDRRESESFQAFDCFMRGMDLVDHFTKEDTKRARELFEEAVRLDPNYGKAYAKLAWTYILDAVEGWTDEYEASMAKGVELATVAVKREDEESWGHWVMAACHFCAMRHDIGLAEFQRALELNPNDADVLADFGLYLSYSGSAEQGVEVALQAMRLNPHYPEYYLLQLGQIYFDSRDYENAISTFGRARNVQTTISHLYSAASYAALGNAIKAEEAIRRVLELDPEATVEKWTHTKMAFYRDLEDLEHLRNALLQAGLPEKRSHRPNR